MHQITSPDFSIIIASHRSDYIGKCVSSFSSVVIKDFSYELIVVADYPVESFTNQYPDIRWIHFPKLSISAKRNAGVAAARGTIIGFTDDDCLAYADWMVAAHVYLAENPDAAGVEGTTTIAADGIESQSLHSDNFRLEQRGFRTNNIFYRANVLRSVGGFDERFAFQREDMDLGFTLIEKKYEIGYSPGIRIDHQVRTGEPWDLLKNCWRRRFDPLLFKKHSLLYRRYIGTPVPPVIMLIWCAEVLTACTFWYDPRSALFFGGAAVIIALVNSMRKLKNFGFLDIIIQLISNIAAPWVLLAALVHGSIKFRSVLLH